MTKQFCRSDLKDRSVPDFSRLAFGFRFRKSTSVHERSVAAAEISYEVTIFCVRYSENEFHFFYLTLKISAHHNKQNFNIRVLDKSFFNTWREFYCIQLHQTVGHHDPPLVL